MAIFAEVSFRQLSASASFRKVHAQASLPSSTVIISVQDPAPEINFQRLTFDFDYRYLAPQIQFQKLFLSDIRLNTEQTIFPILDAFSFSDVPLLNPNLGKSDSIGFSDIEFLGINPVKDDLVSLSEVHTFDIASQRTDSVSLGDIPSLGFAKIRSDTYLVGHDPVNMVINPGNIQFNPDVNGDLGIDFPPSDTASLSDAPALSLSRLLSDTFVLDDNNVFEDLVFSTNKSNVYSLTDVPVIGFSKSLTDNILLAESPVLGNEPKPTDSPVLSDLPALTTGKVFSDSLSVNEQIVLVNFSASSLVGDNLVGLMLLNAD